MKNTMIKATSKQGVTVYVTCPTATHKEFISLLESCGNLEKAETFEVAKMKLSDLPTEVQEKVKSLLRAYDNANVVYEHSKFEVSPHCCIQSSYACDHFVCGRYTAEEVYTKEERLRNFIKEFGYAPCYI